ncbi:MAG: hypothetical protein ACRD9Q_00920 [Nitrososphaeraceae archaeon]
MKTKKQVLKMALLVSILSVGVASLLLLSSTHDALTQIKSKQQMKNGIQKTAIHSGSMGTNMTMDQMLDTMDMMHNMMMNMMRMMIHSNTMNSSSGMTDSNMGMINGMR